MVWRFCLPHQRALWYTHVNSGSLPFVFAYFLANSCVPNGRIILKNLRFLFFFALRKKHSGIKYFGYWSLHGTPHICTFGVTSDTSVHDVQCALCT